MRSESSSYSYYSSSNGVGDARSLKSRVGKIK
jgi:hypothetical protein